MTSLSWKKYPWLACPERSTHDSPVLEEVGIDANARIPPLNVEVERKGDGEVPVVNDEDVADVDLNLDQVGLNAQSFIVLKRVWHEINDFRFFSWISFQQAPENLGK